MDFGKKRQESVYSNRVRAGKRRTYFFDVRKTKGDDYYLTITESTKKFDSDRYERHKIFLYKEDFNRFMEGLEDTVNHVKTELMPDYDYDEFTRRNEEYEASLLERNKEAAGVVVEKEDETTATSEDDVTATSEDDMSW
ncbi:MAG: hypothetical protein ACI94Y_004000 [Maribacter sp.]